MNERKEFATAAGPICPATERSMSARSSTDSSSRAPAVGPPRVGTESEAGLQPDAFLRGRDTSDSTHAPDDSRRVRDRRSQPRWTQPHYATAIGLFVGLVASCSGVAGCASFRATLVGTSNDVAATSNRAGALVLREACAREMAALDRVGTWDGEHCTESGPRAGTPADEAERAELERVRVLWRRVRDTHEAVAQLQRALAASIRASDDAMAYRLLAAVGDLSRAYEAMRAAGRAVGLDLPALPRLP